MTVATAIYPSGMQGEWAILGLLVNQGQETLGRIELLIRAYSDDDALLGQRPVLLEHVPFHPGDETAFRTTLTSTTPITAVEVDVVHVSLQQENSSPMPIDISPVAVLQTETGEFIATVQFTNQSDAELHLEDILFIARNDDGTILAAGSTCYGLHLLMPEVETYCAAVMPDLPADALVEVFLRPREVEPTESPPLTFLVEPVLSFDSQGRPLLTSMLFNEGDLPRTVDIVFIAYEDGDPFALAQASLPAPIPPGESRPLTIVDWLPLQEDANLTPATADSLQFTPYFDPIASSAREHYPRPLAVSIETFEPIGSNLFVSGTLTNEWTTALENPSVLVALHSTNGDLLVSAWEVVGKSIPLEGQLAFNLVIPLPAGIDPAMTEYHIAGYGLRPE